MKKFILMCSFLTISALISQCALAGTFKAKLGVNKQNFATDINLISQTASYKNEFTSLALGLAYIMESGYYIDALMLPSISSNIEGTSRDDFSVVFGKAWSTDTGLAPSLYLGYTNGASRLGPLSYRTYINEIGYVLGGGLGIPLDVGGTIGLSIGVGSMTMEMNEKINGGPAMNPASSNGNIGYSYGLSYTYPINDTFGVTAEYKAQNYNYNFSNKGSISESMNRLMLNLYAQF